ncbi:hypothetical protein [Nannocystis pusilla]|uniref:hypothetical protein n=1 Tax=Nannocystis pusilla TaxID=889268 RepID=UPI003DA3CD91
MTQARPEFRLPREVAGVRIPDSALAEAATRLAYEVSPATLFNHVVRTYVFGALVAARQGVAFDEELFFLGAVLHDLGLTERFASGQRFEVAGADAADAFLAAGDVAAERRAVVWDAIALHTSVGLADRKRPEIALVHIGAGVDVAGVAFDQIPAGAVEQTLDALPRLDFKRAFFEILLQDIARKPAQTMLTWLSDTARRHAGAHACPGLCEVMQAAPFSE